MDFKNVIGSEFDFFGVDSTKFKLGETIYEAVEDPDDGYRSYLGSVEVKDPSGSIFFGQPVARVQVVAVDEQGGFEGYHLVDAGGHVWLRLGTDHSDDYYPTFIFDYQPKAPSGA